MTPACEDAYSKLVEVATVADVSDEHRVGNSFIADLEAKLWLKSFTFVQTLSTLFKILKLKFGQYFAADIWLRLRS